MVPVLKKKSSDRFCLDRERVFSTTFAQKLFVLGSLIETDVATDDPVC